MEHVFLPPGIIGLGQREYQGAFSLGQPGQPILLLFVCASFQYGEGTHDGGTDMGTWNRAAAQFLEQDTGVGEGPALSPELFRDYDSQPASIHQPTPGLRGDDLTGSLHLQQGFFGVFLLGEPANG